MTKRSFVPELSLTDYSGGDARAKSTFIDDLWRGLREFGFIILKNHPVSKALQSKAYDVSEIYFSTPESAKMAHCANVQGQRGYTPFGAEHAKDASVADLKEFFQIGRECAPASPLAKVYPANIWPDEPEFRDTFLQLYSSLKEVAALALDALETPLRLPNGFFRKMATNGNSILRLLHYPPVPDDADKNAIRAAAHEDINLITVLVAANGAGLELLDRNGDWLPIETAPENLIVDAGDMLARITNGVIPATTHRVVNPSGPNKSRYSMPFFMHPRNDAMLACIESCVGDGAKYPPINADDFLQQRLREIGLAS